MISSENLGERFIPTNSTPAEVLVNMERYHYAMTHCIDKVVFELGCGAGLGSYLYSLVARKVSGFDYNQDALKYAEAFPRDHSKVDFFLWNLDEQTPKEPCDIVVALEILEHLENPAKLLAELNTKHLVFSLPLNSLSMSVWHKYPIRGGAEGLKDIRKLIEDKYVIEDFALQDKFWVYGKARKKKSWL